MLVLASTDETKMGGYMYTGDFWFISMLFLLFACNVTTFVWISFWASLK